MSGPAIIHHMGAHILHDQRLTDADNPCGLCLNTGSRCVIRFVTRSKTDQIDMANSRCPNLYKIQLKTAAKFSRKSPCTNIPLRCPLCPKQSDCIWKYNMRAHLENQHPSVNITIYNDLFAVKDEEVVLMKAIRLAKPRTSKKKAKQSRVLEISEGHSSRLALRFVIYNTVISVGCAHSTKYRIPIDNSERIPEEESGQGNDAEESESTGKDLQSDDGSDELNEDPGSPEAEDDICGIPSTSESDAFNNNSTDSENDTGNIQTAPSSATFIPQNAAPPLVNSSADFPAAMEADHPRSHLRRRRLTEIESNADSNRTCTDCDLLIRPDQLLKCNAPLCVENVSLNLQFLYQSAVYSDHQP